MPSRREGIQRRRATSTPRPRNGVTREAAVGCIVKDNQASSVRGHVAQLVERHSHNVEVGSGVANATQSGSSPPVPTLPLLFASSFSGLNLAKPFL
jgi:hypothetical protein